MRATSPAPPSREAYVVHPYGGGGYYYDERYRYHDEGDGNALPFFREGKQGFSGWSV
jgi:hypothetical protein